MKPCTFAAVIVLIVLCAVNGRANGKPASPSVRADPRVGETDVLDKKEIAIRKILLEQRIQLRDLSNQENGLLDAIKNDKTMSKADKQSAKMKIRRDYGGRIEGIILQRRTERRKIHARSMNGT
jgi:hypothetical protein